MGERPKRPKDPILTDGLWGLIQRCLDENPLRRPEITEVICHLRKTSASLQDCVDVREGETVYRAFSSISSFRFTTIGLEATCCSVPGYRLRRRCKLKRFLLEDGPSSDSTCSVGSGETDTRKGV